MKLKKLEEVLLNYIGENDLNLRIFRQMGVFN